MSDEEKAMNLRVDRPGRGLEERAGHMKKGKEDSHIIIFQLTI